MLKRVFEILTPVIPILHLSGIEAHEGEVTSLKSYVQLVVRAGLEPGQASSRTALDRQVTLIS